MRLTSGQLRRIIKEELDNSPQLIKENELHWSAEKHPHLQVGNKWGVARPQVGGRTGVEITWSSDGRREGLDFPLKNADDRKALVNWLNSLEFDAPSEEEEIEDITSETIPA